MFVSNGYTVQPSVLDVDAFRDRVRLLMDY